MATRDTALTLRMDSSYALSDLILPCLTVSLGCLWAVPVTKTARFRTKNKSFDPLLARLLLPPSSHMATLPSLCNTVPLYVLILSAIYLDLLLSISTLSFPCIRICQHSDLFLFSPFLLHATVAFVIFPFDIDTTSATFIPRTSDIGRLQETLLVAEEDTRFNPFRNPSDFAGSDTPQQSSRAYGLTLIYSRAPGDNVLTPDRLDAIKAVRI